MEVLMRFSHIRGVGILNDEMNGYVDGNISVAYEHDQEKDFEGQKTITAAFAFCSPKDNFSRKKGRAIASGRFVHGDTHTVSIEEGGSIVESVKLFLQEDVDPNQLYEDIVINGGTFRDDCVAPRWVQLSMLDQMAVEDLHKAMSVGGCSDPGCDECEDVITQEQF
jgi:hypothetical protein